VTVKKKTTKKKANRKVQTARRPSWHIALEPTILEVIIAPVIEEILNKGVSGKTDLGAKLEEALGCSVSSAKLTDWLSMAGFANLFENAPVFKLPSSPSPVRARMNDDDDDLPPAFVPPADSLAPTQQTFSQPAVPSVNQVDQFGLPVI